MCEAILQKGRGDVVANNVGFVKEHSIENQLPFLQYFQKQAAKVFWKYENTLSQLREVIINSNKYYNKLRYKIFSFFI